MSTSRRKDVALGGTRRTRAAARSGDLQQRRRRTTRRGCSATGATPWTGPAGADEFALALGCLRGLGPATACSFLSSMQKRDPARTEFQVLGCPSEPRFGDPYTLRSPTPSLGVRSSDEAPSIDGRCDRSTEVPGTALPGPGRRSCRRAVKLSPRTARLEHARRQSDRTSRMCCLSMTKPAASVSSGVPAA